MSENKITKVLKAAKDKLFGAKTVIEEKPIDTASLVEQHWNTFASDNDRQLNKVATSYAFIEGEQNRYMWDKGRVTIDSEAAKDDSVQVKDSFNVIRDFMLQWMGAMKQAIPVYKAEANDPENAADQETARIINGTFEYHYGQVWNFDQQSMEKILPGVFKGGQVYNLWYIGKNDDPSGPAKVVKNMVLSALSVTPVGRYETSLAECSAVICEVVLPIRAYCDIFPEMAKDIRDYCQEKDHTQLYTRESSYLSDYGFAVRHPSKGFLPDDNELIGKLCFYRPCETWPDGRVELIIDKKVVAHNKLVAKVIPVEVLSTVEKPADNMLRLPPGYEGVPTQILVNDLVNARRKKEVHDADPPWFIWEGMLIDEVGNLETGKPIGPSQTRTLRPNRKLMELGITGKEQGPWQQQVTPGGATFPMIDLARDLMRSAMHVDPEIAYKQLSGTPASLIQTLVALEKVKLSPGQAILEAAIFRSYKTAVMMMQELFTDKDTFKLLKAGHVETVRWKKDNPSDVTHSYRSQIGVPTTKEQKVKWITGICSALGVKATEIWSKEDLEILIDTEGLGIGRRNVEIELAEYENLKLQNGEIDLKARPDEGYIKGLPVRPEQNGILHLKIHSRLKTSRTYQTLSKDQREALDRHCGEHIVMNWYKANNQAGLFGQAPPVEMDIKLWQSRGVSIPPQVQDIMRKTGDSYKTVIGNMPQLLQPQQPEPQQPGQPPQKTIAEPTGEEGLPGPPRPEMPEPEPPV